MGLEIDACPFANLPEKEANPMGFDKEEIKNFSLAQAPSWLPK
jgi:hypothetical protein